MTGQDQQSYEHDPVAGYRRHQTGKGTATFQIWDDRPSDARVIIGRANTPDEPQAEGVVFSDGVVVLRWLTPAGGVDMTPNLVTAQSNLVDLHGITDPRWRWIG